MKKKILLIEIDEELHYKIKQKALNEKLTIKQWVTLALLDALTRKE